MNFFSTLASLLGGSSFSHEQFDQLREQHPGAILLDVRTRNEFVQAHIAGSTLLPLDQLAASLPLLAAAPAPIVIICHSGGRASTAAAALRRAGKQDVHVLAGGVSNWSGPGRRLTAGAKDIPLRDAIKKAKAPPLA